MDTLIKLFFAFLLTFGLLIVGIWFSEIPKNVTGTIDAEYATLLHSGETVATTVTTKWLAYFFGIGIIGIFSFVIFIGGRKKDPILQKKIYRTLGLGMVLYFVVYNLMVTSWWSYTKTNSVDYFLGLPKPTAWMVFGMLSIPFFISFFYITKFEEWFYTKEDEEKFAEIMANRAKREVSEGI